MTWKSLSLLLLLLLGLAAVGALGLMLAVRSEALAPLPVEAHPAWRDHDAPYVPPLSGGH